MRQRGISRTQVERAIVRGAKSRQDRKIVASYGYFQVVYLQKGDSIQVTNVQLR